jgi:hypothetical protein
MIVSKTLGDEIFKRRTSDIPSLGTVVYADAVQNPLQAKVDEFLETMRQQLYGPSDRSKWERIGQPLFESIIDWGIIINPYTPPKYRLKAIQRQIERFVEVS